MRRREFIALIGSAVAALPCMAHAQQCERLLHIGVLMPFDAQDAFGQQIIGTLYEGLRQQGWEEGRNIVSDVRWIGGDEERRRTYAADLVRASPAARRSKWRTEWLIFPPVWR
jgi:hypothetical protein